MATVVTAGKVKLANGQLVNATNLGWYDGQQYVNGTLSAPGVINSQSGQQGAGQAVSKEVVQQTNPANWDYIQQQQQTYQPSATSQPLPSGSNGVPASSPGTSPGTGFQTPYTAPAAIDLPGLYNTLSKNSGISELEQKLADKATGYADAQSKINDNPYLSESSRVGRVQKLSTDYNNDIKNDQDLLAMKKADIETQLNLQAKQFDINSQASRDALDQFNVLLQSGALNGASGEDIANITRATGLSSSAIQSAVNAQNAKNVQTSVVSYDDGTNQGFAVINTQTGAIVSKQVIAGSKPSTSGGSADLTGTQQRQVSAQAAQALQAVDVNEDMLVSIDEYKKALQSLVAATGVDTSTADNYLTTQMNSLGYKKWKW